MARRITKPDDPTEEKRPSSEARKLLIRLGAQQDRIANMYRERDKTIRALVQVGRAEAAGDPVTLEALDVALAEIYGGAG